jgi:hypothetical protein
MLSITLPIVAIPIGLVIAAGALIRKRGDPNTVNRRYFLFLVWTGIGLLILPLIVNLPLSLPGLGPGLTYFLAPATVGVIVVTLLHLRERRALHGTEKRMILSALLLLVIALIWNSRAKEDWQRNEILFLYVAVITISLFLYLIWVMGNRSPILAGVIALLYMAIFNGLEMGSISLPPESLPGWLAVLSVSAYLAIPIFVIGTTAMLMSNAQGLISGFGEDGSIARRQVIRQLALSVILLGCFLYTLAWLSIWDATDDGVRYFLMQAVSAIVATSTGMLIGMTSSGWRAWSGVPLTVLVIASIWYGVGIHIMNAPSNYTVTEERAARIQQAIESYHAKTGWYPLDLDELVPGEMLRIPLPMIMPGQGWCYQGGSSFYRLGAVYREHWSSPYFSVRAYASAGNVPEESWECDEKLAEAISQSGYLAPPPTPMLLPTSVTSVQKPVIEPLLQAGSFSTGSWSPDGEYLIFGLTKYFMDEVEHVTIDLRFLDAKTGDICQPSQSKWTVQKSDGLREHSAWLPDGRLLYVTDAGEMVAFTPCVDSVEDLASRYPAKFTHVMSSGEQGSRVLLKNEEAYWLLNGNNLKTRKIADLPTETYWSWYDWSPGGERLAISQMSGPEKEDEAFLYIVDWASGEVEKSLPLEGVSDAALPIVEWLTRDELLLHGNTLTLMDFRSEPPITTDVLKDVFLLDIAYPLDVWGMDTVRLKDGENYYIGVQVNHPRNKDAYVYSSKTGQVEVFHHDVSTLIFFPDRQWLRMLKWEDEPTYRDEYVLVWMDQSNEKTRLRVEGHVPRTHPQMIPEYLPASARLVFGSSQGISLVSIPDGKTVGFWELANNADYFSVIPSPNGEALVVAAGGDGLYYISLPGK